MLVLTRRVDGVICIGPDIRITIVGILSDRVKIGIDAPRDVSVDRYEVRQAKERSRKEQPRD